MRQIYNKSETQQDLFAFVVNEILHPGMPGVWVDIGARNFGAGFGQNNTEFLYECGWSGLSLDIGDYESTYNQLDSKRVKFKQLDCTNSELLVATLQENNIPKLINYLSFDIDDATEQGLIALEAVLDQGYLFECATIENDAYRFTTRVRDKQRKLFSERGYILAVELDLYEDWWIHKSVYSDRFKCLLEIKDRIKHNSGFSVEDLNYLHETLTRII